MMNFGGHGWVCATIVAHKTNPRTPRQRGKSFELAVANDLGVRRAHFESYDLVWNGFTIECKKRKQLPKLVTTSMAQAIKNCLPETYPLVVMSQVGQGVKDAYAMIRLRDLKEILGLFDEKV